MTHKTQDVIVIGGGTAGLMAAGIAAEKGLSVTILEKMERPARKLRITGKGRCNLTNIAPVDEFITHFGKNGSFLRQAFDRFFSDDLIDFLAKLGIDTSAERGGRVFPTGDKAQDIVDVLVNWNKSLGVKIVCGSPARWLVIDENIITGVGTSGSTTREVAGEIYDCKACIIATGGSSYPLTGSTGDGYALASAAGHKVIPVRPALVPLDTKGDIAKKLSGLMLKNVNVRLLVSGKKKAEDFGELLFTDTGISGPTTLFLSKQAVDAMSSGELVEISIDFKPGLEDDELEKRLLRDINEKGKETFRTVLNKLLPMKLIPVCIDETGILFEKQACQITGAERARLRKWLKDFRLTVTGHRPWSEAIITAGGVDLKEIDPRTMGSRFVKGLFFAGEVLDIDADTGGFNLQAAFSTGHLAGSSVSVK